MKSLDLFMEKQCSDRRFSVLTSSTGGRSLSREITDLDIKERIGRHQTLSTSDKMMMGCASMALGSPFMLLGLGTAMAFMDDIDWRNQQEELRRLDQEFGADPKRFSKLQLLSELERRKRLNGDKKISSIPLDIVPRRRKAKKGRGGSDFSASRDGERNFLRPYFSSGKNWLEASRILKRKQFLEDQIQKHQGQLDYPTACRISSKIELLNKALKQLGC